MKVAILGYGTVGSGVFEVLHMNHDYIEKCAGSPLDVKYVLDLRDFPGDPVSEVLVHDFNIIKDDPEVDIVVEVMGGEHPAYEFTKACLEQGKAVCTSNKELVAKHGAEFLELAGNNNTNFFFEASVGGGIPIIRPLNRSLTADDILEIKSIINGTTNYILTQMSDNGSTFDDALRDAQAKGFAERNPAADIEGLDACRKTAILSSLANGKQVEVDEIYTEGITKITPEDISYAKMLGYKIKLLSIVKRIEGKTYALVAPHFVEPECPLYNVNSVYNGICVIGNAVGELMFYGSGAGKLPTASAVVGDVVEAAKHRHINVVTIWDREPMHLEKFDEMENCFFVRVHKDMKALAKQMFNIVESIESFLPDEYAFICEPMSEKEFAENEVKLPIISRIRVDKKIEKTERRKPHHH